MSIVIRGHFEMTALPMTRRSVIGTGLAALSVAATSSAAFARTARPFDALFVDAGMALPNPLVAFVAALRKSFPVIDIQLDAAGYARAKAVLDSNQVVLGIGSGATLFCLERIAWDHGYRLTGHSRYGPRDSHNALAIQRNLAAMLGGTMPPVRDYQPSRADGILHLWALGKRSGSQREDRA